MSEPVVAVVVGAGLGVRYGGATPKPALKVTGKALLVMSVEAMAAGGCTDAVVVVNPQVAKKLGPALSALPIPVVQAYGGTTRQQSVRNGLKAVHDDPRLSKARIVLIHDAVRPMVPASVVSGVIRAVRDGAEAVAPAVAVQRLHAMLVERRRQHRGGPIRCGRSDPAGLSLRRPPRRPRKWRLEARRFTDDILLRRAAGHKVVLGTGLTALSMKITEPSDLTVAKALWKARASLGHHSGRRIFRHLSPL